MMQFWLTDIVFKPCILIILFAQCILEQVPQSWVLQLCIVWGQVLANATLSTAPTTLISNASAGFILCTADVGLLCVTILIILLQEWKFYAGLYLWKHH